MYADIIIDITHEKLDRIFQYNIPSRLEGMLKVGTEVCVPFGNGNRVTKGYIISFSEECGYDPDKIKDIDSVAEKGIAIESRLVELAAWLKEHYGGTMIQSLKTVLPIKQKENEKVRRFIRLLLDEEEGKKKLDYYLHKNQRARARLLSALLDENVLEYGLVTKKLNITASVIRALEEQQVIAVTSEQVYRNPIHRKRRAEQQLIYTKEQRHAIDTFCSDYKQGIRKTYLIHGVTGSGKTEVYMEMIAEAVKAGKQAIFLIPEIALTYQTVMRFQRRFADRVSIMHSRLSAGERYDQMMRAKKGEIDVMIGPRSALFTPFSKLGLIVIDEEHEPSYKSEQVPRYHARETAVKRAEMEGASVVLGSATPSVEAYYLSQKGEYELLTLYNRVKMQALPEVYTVDMREELKRGNRSILSTKLQEMVEDRLLKKQQTMLFLNRRGYAGFISCRSCGYVVKCPHCDVSLNAHRGGRLVCHYCGYEESAKEVCPSCGSVHIGGFRAGTQQIEQIVKQQFPSAAVLRMDMDTTRTKDGHEKILEKFANHEADILIGTQMIVKGHDFPNVTLVGILAADLSLYADDYRAGERTFQLLTQAEGRAGRGSERGEAVIQTYSPEHYSIAAAKAQDYERFYKEEIEFREALGYPPAAHLLAVLLTGEEEAHLEMAAGYLKEYAKRVSGSGIYVIGPASPYVGKVNDVYRRVLYFKAETYERLTELKDRMEQYIDVNSGFRKVRIQFDFDPMNIF